MSLKKTEMQNPTSYQSFPTPIFEICNTIAKHNTRSWTKRQVCCSQSYYEVYKLRLCRLDQYAQN